MEQKPQAETQSNPSSLPNGAVKKIHHPPATILHRECLKNHAANLDGHALDGCREFMPSAAANLADPASLKCAACSCHRNFHRRVSISSSSENEIECFASAPHTLLALSRSERPAAARKRFRSKFSGEQKGKMMELAERLGWRLQKRDEGLVEEYCRGIGVEKGVFKVWMHNNKYQLLRILRGGEGRRGVAGDGGGGGGPIVEGNVMNGSFSLS